MNLILLGAAVFLLWRSLDPDSTWGTRNFHLGEFLRTSTGLKNVPTSRQLANGEKMVTKILQPLRDEIGMPIHINSGFRSPHVNEAVGGSKTSDHLDFLAADIVVQGWQPLEVARKIVSLNLPVKQLIIYGPLEGNFVHVSLDLATPPRRQILTKEASGFYPLSIGT